MSNSASCGICSEIIKKFGKSTPTNGKVTKTLMNKCTRGKMSTV